MGMLEIRNLSLSLNGHEILSELNLDLWEGYVHAVVGPNGAGKSTLAFTIMGLEGYRGFSGEIVFDGRSLHELSIDERARLGITLGWQEPARYEGLTVGKFVQVGSKEHNPEVTAELLAKVGLPPGRYMQRAVDKTLSGGERKKVELASLVAMKPRLVMLDEPDSGIDIESLRRIREAIGLLKEQGATVLLITHSLEVLSWAEHAFLLCCGRVVDKGNVDKIAGYFRFN